MSDENSQAERERMVLDIQVKLQVQWFFAWFCSLPDDDCCISVFSLIGYFLVKLGILQYNKISLS